MIIQGGNTIDTGKEIIKMFKIKVIYKYQTNRTVYNNEYKMNITDLIVAFKTLTNLFKTSDIDFMNINITKA